MNKMEQRIRNMKIKDKLGYLTRQYTLGLILSAIVAVACAAMLNYEINSIANSWLPAIELAEEMNYLTSEYRMKQFGHVISSTEDQFVAYETELAEISARIAEIEKEYANTIDSEEDLKLYKA